MQVMCRNGLCYVRTSFNHADTSDCLVSYFLLPYVADDFGYICLDKRQRELVNIVDTFQAQHGDKSCATP